MHKSSENPIIRFIKTLVLRGFEPFGKYYSVYRGFVFDVEDPLNLQRLQLIIPQVSGNQAYNYWAYPRSVFSGKGYGSQCLPKKGDVVWVSFEGGSPEVPIWEHGHFGKGEMPEGDQFKDKKSYWFKSPNGNWVNFYDTKNLIHIENVTGNTLELNEDGIEGKTKKQIYLEGLDKIYLKSDKLVLLEAEKVNAKAQEIINLITTNKISLGTEGGSAQKAVLGDTLVAQLTTILTHMSSAMVLLGSAELPMTPTTIANFGSDIAQLQQLLSNKVSLD